ncbi:MAG: amidase domain-containing protein [Cellulosilyticaceae bacterium]
MKKIASFMCACIVLGSMTTNVMAYDRWAASDYALEWWDGYNTTEYYKAPLDCTNFVSQCLEAGGMQRSSSLPNYDSPNHWRPHSGTWENASLFREYWKNQATYYDYDRITSSNADSLNSYIYSKLAVGDVVQYGYSSSDIKHSQIVHHHGNVGGTNTLRLAQHSSPQKNIALLDYLKSTAYTYVHYYKMPNSNTARSISDDELEKERQEYIVKVQREKELGTYDYMQDVELLMNTIDAVVQEVYQDDVPEEVIEQSGERMSKLEELYYKYSDNIQRNDYETPEGLYNSLREEFDYIVATYR